MEASFDFIVVGGGTAGCLLANRLSTNPATRVLLLEAGGKDDYLWIHIPVGYLYCIGNSRTDWLYHTEAVAGLGGRSIRYPRGKVLGGCSSINGMIYMRGQALDYQGWVEAGNSGWGWDDVLPYFLRHESYYKRDDGSTDPLHGADGEWRVEKSRVRWQILDAFQEAAAQAGIPPTEDFNRGDNFGCGYFEVNQRSGVRWNTSKAFLRPVLSRPNLLVLTKAQVTRLVFSESGPLRVVGVEFVQGGERAVIQTAQCRREVVLAAGAIHSPALLQHSGIGSSARLSDAGIGQRLDLPGVGANLQDHLQLRMIYKVSGVRTLNAESHLWWRRGLMGLQYGLFRNGPLSMSPSQLGVFARSADDVASPDLEYHVQPLSLDKFGEPLHRFPAFTASVCHLRPTSRGVVEVTSGDVFAAPRIAPNYLSTEYDLSVAVRAIELTRRIVGGSALSRYAPIEYLPGADVGSAAELRAAAAQIGTTIFHPVGTCKMGLASDRSAVVDGRLRCLGMSGLRIADASVMPTITSGNTNSPTLMIAERAAEFILADARQA